MSDTVETVKISAPDVPGGYIVINKSDLKPDDTIYGSADSDGTENPDIKKPRGRKG